MHAIDELAEFASKHPDGAMPKGALDACSLLIADLMSATVAGFHSQLAEAARHAAYEIYGGGNSGVWLTGKNLSMAGAAMANSAAASALDIDDGHRGAAGHPGAAIIPAAFAVGQALRSSDTQIFEAIAIGYDVALRVATARPTPTIETYASGRWVSYGVAAAAGRLLHLSAVQMSHALGIAGAEGPIGFPSGSSLYQGSTVKEQIPAAVVAGLTGAFRAQAGATGPRDLLDNERLFRREILTDGLGGRWWLEGCYLKPYACCRYMHAAIDAISAIRRPGAPILSLRIETFPRGLKLSNERAPETLEGAQYSYPFCCALAAIRGSEALQPVDPNALRDPEVLALSAQVELVAHDDFSESFPVNTPCRVTMNQGDGAVTMRVDYPLGDVANPMSRAQIVDKFSILARASIGKDQSKAIIVALNTLTTTGFRPLFHALRSEGDLKTKQAAIRNR